MHFEKENSVLNELLEITNLLKLGFNFKLFFLQSLNR